MLKERLIVDFQVLKTYTHHCFSVFYSLLSWHGTEYVAMVTKLIIAYCRAHQVESCCQESNISEAPFTWRADDPSARIILVLGYPNTIFSFQFTCKVLHLAQALGSSFLRDGLILPVAWSWLHVNTQLGTTCLPGTTVTYLNFSNQNTIQINEMWPRKH